MPLTRLLLIYAERGGGRRVWDWGVEGIKLAGQVFPGISVDLVSNGILFDPSAQVSWLKAAS